MSRVSFTPLEDFRRCPLFAGLGEATLIALLQASTVRRYTRGEDLFSEGDACRGLYLLHSGTVKIYKLNEAGREQILHVQHAGDTIAELPLLDEGRYPASASALGAVTVSFLPRAAFDALLIAHPALSRAVITALARRLRTMVALVEDLSLRQVRQRVARLLLEEAGERDDFLLSYTNEEIAARLGSVRDVISRMLSALHADGCILLTGRTIRILDREGLRRL